MGPLLLVLVNTTVLRESGHWESIHLQPIIRLQSWIQVGMSFLTGDVAAAPAGEAASVPAATSTMINGHMVWTFLDAMQRGLGPIFALLMFGSVWTWRSVWGASRSSANFLGRPRRGRRHVDPSVVHLRNQQPVRSFDRDHGRTVCRSRIARIGTPGWRACRARRPHGPHASGCRRGDCWASLESSEWRTR